MKQPGFIRLATLALLSTLSFFSHGETILRRPTLKIASR